MRLRSLQVNAVRILHVHTKLELDFCIRRSVCVAVAPHGEYIAIIIGKGTYMNGEIVNVSICKLAHRRDNERDRGLRAGGE